MMKRLLLFIVVMAMLLLGCSPTHEKEAQQAAGLVPGTPLPHDVCEIDREPVMPTMMFNGHTVSMVYINDDGDIIVFAFDRVYSVTEGDFCRAEAIRR